MTKELASVIDISVSSHEADIKQTGRIHGASFAIVGSLARAIESIGPHARLPGWQKCFKRVVVDKKCYVNLYPDTSGRWPALKQMFVMPIRQIGNYTDIVCPKEIVLGVILQIEESEGSGQRYRRIEAFEFFSKEREGLGGWDDNITTSTRFGRFSAQKGSHYLVIISNC
jgi:hypothetical protein